MQRLNDLAQFYGLLEKLALYRGCGSRETRTASLVPRRGVYFFYDPFELREDSGLGPRIVRVGTHALSKTSSSTLGQRLAQHRGTRSGGGNHRGSIFRLLIGQAMLSKGLVAPCASWGVKSDPGKASLDFGIPRSELLASEQHVETAVSAYMSKLNYLYVGIDDEPGPSSLRGVVERQSIALLSNFDRPPLDEPSKHWLGRNSNRPLVANSGLWNQRHVTEVHEPGFLGMFANLVEKQVAT